MIEWSGDWHKPVGKVNGVHLYTITRATSHTPDGFPVTMTHRLPFAPLKKAWPTVESAKEYAGYHLDACALHLGYVRKST